MPAVPGDSRLFLRRSGRSISVARIMLGGRWLMGERRARRGSGAVRSVSEAFDRAAEPAKPALPAELMASPAPVEVPDSGSGAGRAPRVPLRLEWTDGGGEVERTLASSSWKLNARYSLASLGCGRCLYRGERGGCAASSREGCSRMTWACRCCDWGYCGCALKGNVAIRGVCAGEAPTLPTPLRTEWIEGAKWKRLPLSSSTLPNASRPAGAEGGTRGVGGSVSQSGEAMGLEMVRSRIDTGFLRPSDANDERDDVREIEADAGLEMGIGEGLLRRRGDLVDVRDGGCCCCCG